MKKKIILLILGYIALTGGAIILGLTVDMRPIHFLAIALLILGNFSVAISLKEE